MVVGCENGAQSVSVKKVADPAAAYEYHATAGKSDRQTAGCGR